MRVGRERPCLVSIFRGKALRLLPFSRMLVLAVFLFFSFFFCFVDFLYHVVVISPLFPVCFPLLSKVISHFSKVRFTPLHFYKRPGLTPVSLTRWISKRIYTFIKKGENKNSIQHLFLQEPLEREKVPWAATVAPPSSFLELHSASSHHISELCLRGSVLYLTIYFA